LVRVDHHLSKNTLLGFKPSTFLDRHPESEDITFFAMLQPSRQDGRVHRVRRQDPRRGQPHQHEAQDDGLDADRPALESNIHRAVAASALTCSW
jgi:hypothetical protein